MFFISALQLYYVRIFKRGVAKRGLYTKIRHPQYLALAVAGLGLLLYWPRFDILVLYVTMLFVYYLLARDEEGRMRRKFGETYEGYARRTSMFIPGEPGGRLYKRLFFDRIRPRGLGIFVLYILAVSLSVSAAFALRGYCIKHIPKVLAGDTMIVPVFPRPAGRVLDLYKTVTSDDRVKKDLGPNDKLVYIMPGDYFLMAVVTDEPRRFPEFMEREFPRILEWRYKKYHGSLGSFFRIYRNFIRAKEESRGYDVERFLFVNVTSGDGKPVSGNDVFKTGNIRSAALLVDMDARSRKIILVKALSGLTKWGRLPMPVF
ncbi:MAG: methyltransferase [Nitrospiraceae bacterium]|nr:methyltransferase [Nitrospiraceae bacterium]